MPLKIKPGLPEKDLKALIGSVPWYHAIDLTPGIRTPGISDVSQHAVTLHLPEDCTGMRVMDIGPADGFYTFLMEQRGATVVSLEKEPRKTFEVLREITGCRTELVIDNVYNISREKYDTFDIVLFLGVLYHLRNPMLVLDGIREVCTKKLFAESHVEVGIMSPDLPVAQFYPGEELGQDYTNWWGPNVLGFAKMIEASGFKVTHVHSSGSRAVCVAVPIENERLDYFIKYDYKYLR